MQIRVSHWMIIWWSPSGMALLLITPSMNSSRVPSLSCGRYARDGFEILGPHVGALIGHHGHASLAFLDGLIRR